MSDSPMVDVSNWPDRVETGSTVVTGNHRPKPVNQSFDVLAT
jgi:hypothetical protein